MVAILCIIFATYLSALTPLVFEACDQLVPVVFGIDQIYFYGNSNYVQCWCVINDTEIPKKRL